MATQPTFSQQIKEWANLEPYNVGNLSNREILEDTVTSMLTVLALLRPHVVHKAPPIDVGLLTELVATTQTNVRWLKTILERSPKQNGFIVEKTANVYISTVEPGKFVVHTNPPWSETYDDGFAPLLHYWQWANNFR